MRIIKGFAIPDEETYLGEYIAGMIANDYQGQKVDTALRYIKKFGVALDVGSHVGLLATQFARHFEVVICFEPRSSLKPMFEYNTRGFANIGLNLYALGAEEKTIGIEVDTSRSMEAFVTAGSDYEQKRLDDVVVGAVDFIKIDVEGYELNVLKGAGRVLAENDAVLMIEHRGHESRFGERPEELKQFLHLCGYTQRREMNNDFIFTKDTYCLRPKSFDPKKPIAILGGGPSFEPAFLDALQDDTNLISINDSIVRTPRAMCFFTLDGTYFRSRTQPLNGYYGPILVAIPKSRIDKLGLYQKFPDRTITVLDRSSDNAGFSNDPLRVNGGGTPDIGASATSGYGALNLAVQWVEDNKKIILVGFDNGIPDRHGVTHWNRPSNTERWHGEKIAHINGSYEVAARAAKERGITVINASTVSNITAFPKMSLEEALAWDE